MLRCVGFTKRVPAGLVLTAFALCILGMMVPEISAAPAQRATYATTGDLTLPPSGYLQLCQDDPSECRADQEDSRDVVLNTLLIMK